MLKPECTITFDPVNLVECDPCRHYYFKRVVAIRTSKGVIIATLHYDLRTCFLGLGKGDYLNTISLLPAEEIELDIIRRSKYSEAMHQESSLETEFENTFTETIRDRFNLSGEFKFAFKTEGKFSIFDIGAKAETELSLGLKVFYERFKEIVDRTRTKVSRKYDFSIDVKSEVENTFRTIRKIKNPNNCHPVLYMISQLLKKFKSELILTKIEFDYQRKLPPILSKDVSTVSLIKPILMPFHYFYSRVEAPSIKKKKIKVTDNVVMSEVSQTVRMIPAEIKELNEEEVLRLVKEDERTEVKRVIGSLQNKEQFKPGVKSSVEYCVRTSDIYIETKISPCSACCEDDCQ